jgi:biopolymer transport protein ExbD
MHFRSRQRREEPEINLIPLIDVLLVILIFLMITTTYSRFTELQIQLPTADAERAQQRRPRSSCPFRRGVYSVNKQVLEQKDVTSLADQLRSAAGPASNGHRQWSSSTPMPRPRTRP